MNKFRYTFIFLILFSLFPCHEILANEETNNVPLQEITKNNEEKNTTKNVTEITNTSTIENKSNENAVNIETQKEKSLFGIVMYWIGLILTSFLVGILNILIGFGIFWLSSKNKNSLGWWEKHETFDLASCFIIIWAVLTGIAVIVLKVIVKTTFLRAVLTPIFVTIGIPLLIILAFLVFNLINKILWQIEKKRKCNKLTNTIFRKEINIEELNSAAIFYVKYNNHLKALDNEIEKNKNEYEKIKKNILKGIQKKKLSESISQLEKDKSSYVERNKDLYIKVCNLLEKTVGENNAYLYCEHKETINDVVENKKIKLYNKQVKANNKLKTQAYEQIQNDAVKQAKANEDAMRKNEVERNIDQLSDYIDMLGESIQKKELPDVQVVSELSKILDLIFNNKSYIAKEDFNKIRNDNEVFVKHVLKKCHKIKNFSGSLLETRMKQVKAKFDEILK